MARSRGNCLLTFLWNVLALWGLESVEKDWIVNQNILTAGGWLVLGFIHARKPEDPGPAHPKKLKASEKEAQSWLGPSGRPKTQRLPGVTDLNPWVMVAVVNALTQKACSTHMLLPSGSLLGSAWVYWMVLSTVLSMFKLELHPLPALTQAWPLARLPESRTQAAFQSVKVTRLAFDSSWPFPSVPAIWQQSSFRALSLLHVRADLRARRLTSVFF